MISFLSLLFLSFTLEFGIVLVLLNVPSINSRIDRRHRYQPLLIKLIVTSYVAFFSTSIYSLITAHRLFISIYIYSILVGSIVLYSLVKTLLYPSNSLGNCVLFCTLSLPLMVLATSLAVNGPAPLTTDEHTPYAFIMLNDYKWIPFKYVTENTYYQYFHVMPFIEAWFSIMTGLDIFLTNPLLDLCLTFFTTLTIYALSKRVIEKEKDLDVSVLAILSPILYLLSPPISMMPLIPQNLSVSLSLCTILLLARLLSQRNPCGIDIIPLIVLSITGLITHPIYPTLLLPSLGTLVLLGKLKKVKFPWLIYRIFKILTVITLFYWTCTVVIDQIVNIGRGVFESFITIISGEAQPFSRPFLYANSPPWIACSWSFLPAIASAMVLLELMNVTASRRLYISSMKLFKVALALSGLALLVIGLVLHMASLTLMHRYVYPAYFLLIPLSLDAIKKTSNRRVMNVLLIASMIAAIAFEGIQDPAFSPDIHRVTTVADRRSWIVAETIIPLCPLDVSYAFDTRVYIGFNALATRYISGWVPSMKPHHIGMVIVNLDIVGKSCLEFWFGSEWSESIKNGDCEVVFSDGLYKAFVK